MMVFYRCEDEMGRTAVPEELDDLLENFRCASNPMTEEIIHDIRGALDIWGGYQGLHDFGRFVIVAAPKIGEDMTHEDYGGGNKDAMS